MKIALIGYGKMGHAIERIALERGHEVTAHVDATLPDSDKIDSDRFRAADVAIEFTVPSAAVANYRAALAQGVPVVSGTTGWTSAMPEVRKMVEEVGGTLLWTSNFSIGVNLFMRINAYAARLMSRFAQYAPSMEEIHHIHKLDHPSGTAITLAEGIIANDPAVKGWAEPEEGKALPAGTLPIAHERIGEVPGTHIVRWTSDVDCITLEHKAFSRDGFALGAVIAAEWIAAHPEARGVLGMDDTLLKGI